MNIGQMIYDIFGNNGEIGLLLCIFLIFLLDALLIPTLPELFFVIAFIGGANYRTPWVFGVELLVATILAEQIGILSLYYVVKHVRIPAKIQVVADKYTQFLLLSNERLLLLNRVAPMLPFAGAFIAILKWNVKKSMFFVALGCVLKYGLIMVLSNFFYDFFSSDDSQLFTLVMIIAVIATSMVCSFVLKKRKGLD